MASLLQTIQALVYERVHVGLELFLRLALTVFERPAFFGGMCEGWMRNGLEWLVQGS